MLVTNTVGKLARPRITSTSITAALDDVIHVTASATITDPGTPAEGRGYTVRVVNGTATVGGIEYAVAGTVLVRLWHSGSWQTVRVFEPSVDATTSQRGLVELATDGESAAGKAVQGNDSRMSNARTPTAHTHSIGEVTGLQSTLGLKADKALQSLTFVVESSDNAKAFYGDIPDDKFGTQSTLKALQLGNSVTSIGSFAFYNCSGFDGNLIIPDSVTEIGSYAFYNCSGFDGNLIIPDSVTSIGSGAFENCSNLDTMYAGFNFSAFTGGSALASAGITQIYVKSGATGWTLGSGQTIQGKTGITVSNWDNYPNPIPN